MIITGLPDELQRAASTGITPPVNEVPFSVSPRAPKVLRRGRIAINTIVLVTAGAIAVARRR